MNIANKSFWDKKLNEKITSTEPSALVEILRVSISSYPTAEAKNKPSIKALNKKIIAHLNGLGYADFFAAWLPLFDEAELASI